MGKLYDRTEWLGVDGRIIFKWIVRKQVGDVDYMNLGQDWDKYQVDE